MTAAVVVGAAESPYSRHPPPDTTTYSVLADAGRRALACAGLTPRDVDGLAVASFSLAPDHAIDLAWRLGLRVRWLMDAHTGGASGIDMLQHARRAVEAGDALNVLILAGDVLSAAAFGRLVDEYNTATRDHLRPIPTGGPNALFALLTKEHMERHGLTRADYGAVVVAQREWARLNPAAVYRSPLTLHDYLAQPYVAEPLCRYDCVPVVAGANAVVVSGQHTGVGPGVRVAALGALHNDDHQEGDGLETGLRALAPTLWEEAGHGPEAVDLVSVYDDYPVMALVQLEDLGFAGASVKDLVISRLAGRELPVNTSGGQLSAGQAGAAGGLHGVVEAVIQLRGEAGERQVRDARIALVTGYGMVPYRYGACANAAVLVADR
jgi:acetyl-CoA acetyltransferase